MCGGISVNAVFTKLLRPVAWDIPLIILIHPCAAPFLNLHFSLSDSIAFSQIIFPHLVLHP